MKQKRRLRPLGVRGRWMAPRVIEGGAWHGKVKKTLPRAMTRRQLETTKQACQAYQRALQEAGVGMVPARLGVTGTGSAWRLHFIQERVPQERVLAVFLRKAEKETAALVFRQMLAQLEKVMAYNRRSKKKLALEAHLQNWAFLGGKVKLLDFFPPYIRQGLFYHDPALGQSVSRLYRAGHYALYPVFVRRRFDPKKALRLLVYQAVQARPDLASRFLQEARGFVQTHFSGRAKKRLLADLASPKWLSATTLLGRVATALEARAQQRLQARATARASKSRPPPGV